MARIKIERKTDWELREVNPDDKERIKSFYRQNIWKSKDADSLYKWKYEENPFDRTLMYVGVNSAQEIISNCVFMPWQLRLNGELLKAIQIIDGVTQLEYRGQGIPFEQVKRGIEEAIKKGALFCFAFPNEAGVAFHKRNNGFHLGHILRYTKPLRTEYLINRFIKLKLLPKALSFMGNIILKLCSKETYCLNLNRFVVKKVENCGDEFDKLWDRFSSKVNNKVITRKDGKYLNWKYLNSPDKKRQLYSIKRKDLIYGFVVLESTPQIGYIVDLLACDKDVLNHLIAYAIKHFRRQSKDSLVFVAMRDNMYFNNLKSFGFVERPEKKHFYIYLDEGIKNKNFFMDSKNWFITIGDCDVESL